MRECEQVSQAKVNAIDLGTGLASAVLELPRALFYHTLSQQSGFQIGDDGDLMALLTQLSQVKASYDKVADALKEVEETGYGIVVPSIDSLKLEEPEIVKQGGRYGVRRGALHRLPEAGGAGDRQAGRKVRGAPKGQRTVYPYDPSRH